MTIDGRRLNVRFNKYNILCNKGIEKENNQHTNKHTQTHDSNPMDTCFCRNWRNMTQRCNLIAKHVTDKMQILFHPITEFTSPSWLRFQWMKSFMCCLNDILSVYLLQEVSLSAFNNWQMNMFSWFAVMNQETMNEYHFFLKKTFKTINLMSLSSTEIKYILNCFTVLYFRI